jgi:SAM-dependent methyltransferase
MDFKKFYDEQKDYKSYRENPEKKEEYSIDVKWKVDSLSDCITSGSNFSNILEVGCAFGLLLNSLASKLKIKNVVGLDISSENIDLARSLFPDLTFIKGTIEEQSFKQFMKDQNYKFDLILLSDIIEHVSNDIELLKLLKNYGKYFLINLPLEKSISTRRRNYGDTDSSGHLRSYNLNDALTLFKNAGLDIINFKIKIASSDMGISRKYKEQQRLRLRNKPLINRVFWKVYYKLFHDVLSVFPSIYIRIYGCNIFAYLKSSE